MQNADYPVPTVNRPGVSADDGATFTWPTSPSPYAEEGSRGSLDPLVYGEPDEGKVLWGRRYRRQEV